MTKPEERAKSFALIGIAFGVGFFLGPWVSGYLAHFDMRYPIVLAAGLSALSILATLFLLPSVDPKGAPAARAFSTPKTEAPVLYSQRWPG